MMHRLRRRRTPHPLSDDAALGRRAVPASDGVHPGGAVYVLRDCFNLSTHNQNEVQDDEETLSRIALLREATVKLIRHWTGCNNAGLVAAASEQAVAWKRGSVATKGKLFQLKGEIEPKYKRVAKVKGLPSNTTVAPMDFMDTKEKTLK